MPFQLIFTEEAKGDVKAVARYYENQLTGLGKRYKNEVRQRLVQLKQNPHTHSIRYNNVRMAVIPKFPYSIHYTIEVDQVKIYAIISDYRNPANYRIKTDDDLENK